MRTPALLFGMILLCSALHAQDLAELEVDHNVNSEFVTPHTDWGSPWAQGKARVLFFVNGRGTAAREVIELKQRFDLDPQMVFWGRIVDTNKDAWHGGDAGIERMAGLLGQKWNAYVFLGLSPELLPTEQQYKVIEAVTNGAGLVLVGVDDKRVLKPKNLLKAPAPWLAAPAGDPAGAIGAAYTVVQGRGIRLGAAPQISYRPGWETDYDYWQFRLGKAILWAAGKAPRLQVELTGPVAGAVRISCQDAAAAKGVALDLTLRRSDGWTRKLPAPGSLAAGNLSVAIPTLRAGQYHVDAIARGRRGIEEFATAAFEVTSTRTVTAVTLERDWGEVGETLAGKVACASDRTGPDERLVVSLLDRRGRELLRQNVGAVATEGSFRFPVEEWLPMLVTVQATLVRGDQEIASAWQFARVTKRRRGRFNFLMWDMPGGNLGPYGEESLARTGVTLQLTGGPNPPAIMAAFDIAHVPYTTDISAQKDTAGVMKPFCWNDEAQIQAHVDRIAEKHLPARGHGVFVYSLGDEIAVRGSCVSPHCLAAYQEYLEREYGSIAALNVSWGTQYASFRDVRLSAPDDDKEGEALRAGNFPRWFDRQAYQSYNFCKLCERFGKAFRKIDPESRCGFEGAGTFGAADDLDGFVRSNTFWSPYPGAADEVLRSIAPRDFPRANWMGYTKDANSLLEKYWRMVTRGTDSVWWWRWEVVGRFHGWLAPNFDPYPAVKEILADTQVVRDGLGDLLLQCRMQDDGVGILYSLPSAYAAKVGTSPSYATYEDAHTAWHSALRSLHLNFRYFTDRQMRLGEVDLGQFRVIVLPLTQALGAKEAQLLRDYVQSGGTLIADVRPGIYDGHLKALATGALDDLFGVRRAGSAAAAIADGTVAGTLGSARFDAGLKQLRVDGGVTAAGAGALGSAGQTPLLLVNTVGKGRAILLNFPLVSYPSLDAEATPEAAAEVIRALVSAGGIQPALALSGAKGARLRNCEVTRWADGDTQILSLFRHSGTPEPAKVTFPESVRLYDLKNHREFGPAKSFDLRLTPSRAQFFAVSKVPLAAAEVSVDKPTAAPGSVPAARVRIAQGGGRQAVKLQVKLPNGQVADWLDRVIVTDRQGTTVPLPIAFNDPVGAYTVTATELFTNRTSTCQIRVK